MAPGAYELVLRGDGAPGVRSALSLLDARYAHLFNSYYESLGPRHARELRGLLTRPPHGEVLRYRATSTRQWVADRRRCAGCSGGIAA